MTFQLVPPVPQYPLADKGPDLYHSLIENLQTIPGVRSAAVSSGFLRRRKLRPALMITTEARCCRPGPPYRLTGGVSPLFRHHAIPMLRGRTFTDADSHRPGDDRQPVDRPEILWRCRPARQTLRPTAKPELAYTIVGVVGDVRDQALNQQTPTLYYSIPNGARGLLWTSSFEAKPAPTVPQRHCCPRLPANPRP